MPAVSVNCTQCGTLFEKERSQLNRALKAGPNLYCGRVCTGLARRKPKLPESERKRLKAEYDREYRRKNKAILKAKKAQYFKQTYDPKIARVERKKRMHKHVEYCRRPEYRKKKKAYDRQYRARRIYGGYADAFLTLQDLETEVFSRQPRSEIKYQNGATNKTQNRRRDYVRQINGH